MNTKLAFLLPALLVLTLAPAGAAVRYVNLANPSPAPPYATWACAATNIQDAIDLANAGDEILVTNGNYSTGVRFVDGSANRLIVDKPLAVHSVNGPQFTTIDGGNETRCVYLRGATLSGFTLTNGFTLGGGGIWCESASDVVSNCVIVGNSAGTGGGAYQGTLNNCVLSDNFARSGGGGADSCILNHCALTGNSALYGGGASGSRLNNCTLSSNSAADFGGGGAMQSVLYNCSLKGNSANRYGGGALASTLSNCVLTGNSAQECGGGVAVGTLNNCTLTGNSAKFGGGVAGVVGEPGGVYLVFLNNCIVQFNTAVEGANYGAWTILNYCCTTPLPAAGRDNISVDPLFVDLAGDNLRLQSNSPCINAGNNTFAPAGLDVSGNSRIVGGTVDVGAYEFQSPQSLLSYAWLQQYRFPIDGSADNLDFDGDGFTNFQEWRAGTDPTNTLSALRLLTPMPVGLDLVVRWASVSGKFYSLERSTNLMSSEHFIPIARNIPGEAESTHYTDPNVATNGQRFFYRVGIE